MNTILRMLIASALLCPSAALAQRGLKDIPDPDPELERLSFRVAEGFEVNLYAADPLLAKPIQMNFDPRGRLWVASSEVYPQIKPGQAADDRVLVLEDLDGDGRADRTTVFAGGLLIPTGVEPGDGGAYVANSTELVHLRDLDGDGKADDRRVVLSGFGTEDTHHILHTFRWGFDGHLYFNQSVYIHSHVETPWGVRRLGGGGTWRFRPESMQLEVFTRGLINPWGHHFDRWGQGFLTDGAGFEGVNYALPGASAASIPNPARYLKGLNPGSPKYCGLEVVDGRHLPDDWQGNLVTNDFRGNRVCRYVLSDDGAGFAAREQVELIKTDHVAFRPIDVKMGPDGAIYIADWYNPIIQHGEVDFRDPRRDHTRGRIWRVTAKGRPLVDRPMLVNATVGDLLDALKAPEGWTRQQARRVLKERGPEAVASALSDWVARLDPADPEVEHHRLEALWTHQALDLVAPGLLAALLEARDPRARAAASRVVGDWADRLSDPIAMLADRVIDDHPRVRLEAVRALARIPEARSAEIALRVLDRPMDRFLDYGLWLTIRELAPAWLPKAEAGRLDDGGDPRRWLFALEAVGTPEVVAPIRERLRTAPLPPDLEARALTLIADLGGSADLATIVDLVVLDDPARSVDRRVRLLEALNLATRRAGGQPRGLPEGDLTQIAPLLRSDHEAIRTAAARLAGAWHLSALRGQLVELASDPNASYATLQAAADAVAETPSAGFASRDQETLSMIYSRPGAPPSVRMAAAAARMIYGRRRGAYMAAAVLAGDLDGADPSPLFDRVLELKNQPQALAEALADFTIPADVAKLGIRKARASGQDQTILIEALTRAGKLGSGPAAYTPEQKAAILADVARSGDPARGEAIFRLDEQSCLKCHAIGGAGGQVGPDLGSIGASAPDDYLLDALLEPDKAVKEGYHALTVATDDGRIATGIKVRQTDAELVLRDAEDREVAIPTARVEDQKPAGSLMPAGLVDPLTRPELVDLVRFLSELGESGGRYTLGQDRVVRRWEALDETPETGRHLTRFGLDMLVADGSTGVGVSTLATGDPTFHWAPAYSLVSGSLPLNELPAIPINTGEPGRFAIARARLDVSTPGPVRLRLDSPAGLTLWVDQKRVDPKETIDLDLAPGLHTLTFAVDLDRRGADRLRCELDDVPGSSARVQVVSGK